MSKTLRIILAATAVLFIGCGLVYTGIWIGRYGPNPFSNQWSNVRWDMHSRFGEEACEHPNYSKEYGMMGRFYRDADQEIHPLTMEEVEISIDQYLDDLSDPDLILSEIMIFDNHAYAQIIEESTGVGAMEVLVDPQSKQVYPEHGPNMMWNLKYSPMGTSGEIHGPGMMRGTGLYSNNSNISVEDIADMPVSSEKAVDAAQDYLDRYQPGNQADDHSDLFYGYYTLHVLDGGEVVGMLSVNGYSGQVFYHDWHGELIETSDH
ncbi:MAG: hypothetical protein WBB69_08515 [Anaerolineales bacterium]